MPAQYAHLDGRRYVNEDFLAKVREKYPATTKKIPLGYSTYTGWTGKDQVLFTQHEPLDEKVLDGPVYEVTFDPSHPECFEEDILGQIKHTTVQKRASVPRRRLEPTLEERWGSTLGEAMGRRAAEKRRKVLLAKKQSFARLRGRKASPEPREDWIAWDATER